METEAVPSGAGFLSMFGPDDLQAMRMIDVCYCKGVDPCSFFNVNVREVHRC